MVGAELAESRRTVDLEQLGHRSCPTPPTTPTLAPLSWVRDARSPWLEDQPISKPLVLPWGEQGPRIGLTQHPRSSSGRT